LTDRSTFADLVTIGRVVKPQGRRGEVLVHVLSDRPDRFSTLQRAYVLGPDDSAREVRVTASWPHKGQVVLKLEGIDSINDAETLRGMELRLAEDDLDPLGDGEYYHHQLLGLAVVDEAGRSRGRVTGLIEAGSAPGLEIQDGTEEILVPLVDSFLLGVDLGAGRIVLRIPETVDAAR
jgi:16S rRNA processing protein RimM